MNAEKALNINFPNSISAFPVFIAVSHYAIHVLYYSILRICQTDISATL